MQYDLTHTYLKHCSMCYHNTAVAWLSVLLTLTFVFSLCVCVSVIIQVSDKIGAGCHPLKVHCDSEISATELTQQAWPSKLTSVQFKMVLLSLGKPVCIPPGHKSFPSVGLIDDSPFSSFQGRLSQVSSFCCSLFLVINGVWCSWLRSSQVSSFCCSLLLVMNGVMFLA